MASGHMSLLESLKQAVIDCDEKRAVQLAISARDAGIDPMLAIEQGLTAGLRQVGDAFGRGDAFLPDLVMSGEAMKAASRILEAELTRSPADGALHKKTVVLGTVRNDIHDIGKSLVGLMLFCAGWKVVDLGTSVTTEKFIAAVEENQPQLLGLSSLLTTTAPEMSKIIKALEERDLRSKVKVIVGGGAITADYARKIGADAYGADASDGARKADALFAAVESGD